MDEFDLATLGCTKVHAPVVVIQVLGVGCVDVGIPVWQLTVEHRPMPLLRPRRPSMYVVAVVAGHVRRYVVREHEVLALFAAASWAAHKRATEVSVAFARHPDLDRQIAVAHHWWRHRSFVHIALRSRGRSRNRHRRRMRARDRRHRKDSVVYFVGWFTLPSVRSLHLTRDGIDRHDQFGCPARRSDHYLERTLEKALDVVVLSAFAPSPRRWLIT